jgi:hypothetical protein
VLVVNRTVTALSLMPHYFEQKKSEEVSFFTLCGEPDLNRHSSRH